ncbi:MAG: YqaA family protein [Planctomycetota bacterium]
MPDLVQLGLLGLFIAAALAGSVVPFPSEGVLAALVGQGQSIGLVVGVATVGNVLGAITLYAMGWALERGLLRGRLQRRLADDPQRLERARERIGRWGSWGLLLAWVPIVGDAFVLGAGLVRVRFWLFLALVTLGKGGRYVVVAWTAALAAGG